MYLFAKAVKNYFTKQPLQVIPQFADTISIIAPLGHPTLKVRKGGGEEIPLVQGKAQRLRFAGAAMNKYPTPKVRETQVRG